MAQIQRSSRRSALVMGSALLLLLVGAAVADVDINGRKLLQERNLQQDVFNGKVIADSDAIVTNTNKRINEVRSLPCNAQYKDLLGSLFARAITAPSGALWLPSKLGGGRWWYSDAGFTHAICRLATAPNRAPVCETTPLGFDAPGPMAVGQQLGLSSTGTKQRYVYVADVARTSDDVYRLKYDEAGYGKFSLDLHIKVAPEGAGTRPSAMAVVSTTGTDTMYVAFQRSGAIHKVSNANSGTPGTPEVVARLFSDGKRFKGRRITTIAYLAGDLYVVDGDLDGVKVIKNIASCTAAAPCTPVTVAAIPANTVNVLTAFDGSLYIGEDTVVRKYTPATGAIQLLSSGFLRSAVPTAYNGISSLAVRNGGAGKRFLAVGADPLTVPNNGGSFYTVKL